MASDRVKIDGMAAAIMKGLEEYAEVATSDLKASVRKAEGHSGECAKENRCLFEELVSKDHKRNI